MKSDYDLTDRDTVVNLLTEQIDWCKTSPGNDSSFGSYGPSLSSVLAAAVSMLTEQSREIVRVRGCLKESVEAIEETCKLLNLGDRLIQLPDYMRWKKELDK